MSLMTNSNALAEKLQSRDATREPTWVRYTLITIALIFFMSCLILPLILVFVEAFKQGVGVYFQALVHPDTLSAVKLTLITAAIAVPINVIFGVAAAWSVAKFNFRGKSIFCVASCCRFNGGIDFRFSRLDRWLADGSRY